MTVVCSLQTKAYQHTPGENFVDREPSIKIPEKATLSSFPSTCLAAYCKAQENNFSSPFSLLSTLSQYTHFPFVQPTIEQYYKWVMTTTCCLSVCFSAFSSFSQQSITQFSIAESTIHALIWFKFMVVCDPIISLHLSCSICPGVIFCTYLPGLAERRGEWSEKRQMYGFPFFAPFPLFVEKVVVVEKGNWRMETWGEKVSHVFASMFFHVYFWRGIAYQRKVGAGGKIGRKGKGSRYLI